MAKYICIDGGTTNTRISLVQQNQVTDTLRISSGARNAMEDTDALAASIRDGISRLLNKHNLQPSQITKILAAGMITSEFGLCLLPHIPAPAGLQALHLGMREVQLQDISEIPFVFVPGVKMNGGTLETTDMMRGEEAELMGLFAGEGLYILPGSHSKLIAVDPEGTIRSFQTMLTGEMLAALASNTILKDAVSLQDHPVDPEHLRMGYRYAAEHGISEALFKVRVLKNIFGKTPGQLYNFYLGAVLCPEIQCILRQAPKQIILGGKKALKETMAALLRMLWDGQITTISEELADHAAPLGMVKIYEYSR